MPTFDEALEHYRNLRSELRGLQSDLDKLANERRKVSKDIAAKHGDYKRKRKQYLEAANVLMPELNKEIQAHPLPADLTADLTDSENEEMHTPLMEGAA